MAAVRPKQLQILRQTYRAESFGESAIGVQQRARSIRIQAEGRMQVIGFRELALIVCESPSLGLDGDVDLHQTIRKKRCPYLVSVAPKVEPGTPHRFSQEA